MVFSGVVSINVLNMGGVLNRQEKSFRHVTMVAKILDLHELLTTKMPSFSRKIVENPEILPLW